MKILFANWKDINHPDAGGAELVIHEIGKRFVQRGHEVTILTSRPPSSAFNERIDGIHILRIGQSRFLHPFLAHVFYKIFLKGDFDVVIESINTSPYFLGLITDRSKKVQLYYQLAREVWFYELPYLFGRLGYYLLEPLALFINSLPDCLVMSISKSTSDDLKRFGYKNHRIKTFTIGMNQMPVVSEEVGREKSPIFTVLFHSSMRDMKRPSHVVDAFRLLLSKGVKAQLWISGGGDQARLRDLVNSYGMSNLVTFFGRVTESQRTELMRQASVICCTSIKEGWGLIVSEANSQGTPAIVYDVDGLRDAAAYSGSYICDPDPPSMALSLETLANMFHNNHVEYLGVCRSVWSKVLCFNFDNAFSLFEKSITDEVGIRHCKEILPQ